MDPEIPEQIDLVFREADAIGSDDIAVSIAVHASEQLLFGLDVFWIPFF